MQWPEMVDPTLYLSVNKAIIVSDNYLSSIGCQANYLTNAGLLLIRPVETNVSEI